MHDKAVVVQGKLYTSYGAGKFNFYSTCNTAETFAAYN